MTSGTTFQFEIDGPSAGNGGGFHDQIKTTGTISLEGTLVLSMSYAGASVGDEFFIWLNDSSDAISGAGFSNAPNEGDFIAAGGGGFNISYLANGDLGSVGNDISLKWVPEPGTSTLTAGAGLLALSRRRRRTAA